MKTRIQQPKQESRTIQSKTKVANQVSIAEVLQKYRDKTVQRENMPEEELLQGKFAVTQMKRRAREIYYSWKRKHGGGKPHGKSTSIPKERLEKRAIQSEQDIFNGLYEKTVAREGEHLTDERVTQLKSNNTGLPDNLKSGIENLSGYSMDDVRVHYNSPKPAQLQALAYTQGTDIHVAPGQEKHLPHEAWHVVQQKQGRVQPTMQLQGVNVNDNEGLEREADVMGCTIQCYKEIYRRTFKTAQDKKQGSRSHSVCRRYSDGTITRIHIHEDNGTGKRSERQIGGWTAHGYYYGRPY